MVSLGLFGRERSLTVACSALGVHGFPHRPPTYATRKCTCFQVVKGMTIAHLYCEPFFGPFHGFLPASLGPTFAYTQSDGDPEINSNQPEVMGHGPHGTSDSYQKTSKN